jgi:hypothetical protein
MHAYTLAGEPRHYQDTKKGAKNPTRPTTIKDIREQKLLPSVTDICKMLSAPGLEEYKIGQVIQACFEDTPSAGEDMLQYKRRIQEKAGADAAGAADLGTLIHNSMETYLARHEEWDGTVKVAMPDGREIPIREFVLPAALEVDKLGIANKVCESVVVNAAAGYAGTVDLNGTRITNHRDAKQLVVADFKSKRTKPGQVVEPIETHPVQIAAYIAALGFKEPFNSLLGPPEGYNIYISTTEIGRVDVVHYDTETISRSQRIFEHLLALWRWRYFDPRQV